MYIVYNIYIYNKYIYNYTYNIYIYHVIYLSTPLYNISFPSYPDGFGDLVVK